MYRSATLLLSILACMLISPTAWAADDENQAEPTDANRRLMRLCEQEIECFRVMEEAQLRVLELRQKIAPVEQKLMSFAIDIASAERELEVAKLPKSKSRDDDRRGDDVKRVEAKLKELKAANGRAKGQYDQLAFQLRQAVVEFEAAGNRVVRQNEEFWQSADVFGRCSKKELLATRKILNNHMLTNPKSIGARLARGITNRRLNEIRPALIDYSELIVGNSNVKTVALMARAELFTVGGKEKLARDDLHLVNMIQGKSMDAYVQLYKGWILCGQKRYELGVTELKRALKLGRVDAEVHRLLAVVGIHTHKKIGAPVKLNQALEHAERAVELTRKSDWLSLEALAACQYLQGDKEAAAETVALMIELTSDEVREHCEQLAKQLEADTPPIPAGNDPFRVSLGAPRQDASE